RAIVDTLAEPTIHASVGDSAEQIHTQNLGRFPNGVYELVAAESTDANARRELIYHSWNNVFQEITATNQLSLQMLKHLEGHLDSVDRERVQAEQARELQNKFAALEASVYIVSAVAGADNPRLGRQIQGIGSGAIQIGTSVATAIAAGALTAVSCCTLVGGIVV